MKKIILISLMFFLFQGTALAQQNKNGEKLRLAKNEILQEIKGKRRVLKAFENCASSASSQKALRPCRQQYRIDLQNLRKNNKRKREQLRAAKQRQRNGVRSFGRSYEGS
jgi:biopolymer transport protein ExbB/TolQ